MVRALIGMGSNIDPETHLATAAEEIRIRFGDVRFSHVYRSKAVGMEGEDFLNACCLIDRAPGRSELVAWFKQTENSHGRDRSEGSWKPRTLDLDLLIYDDEVVDEDLYRYAHIFVPAGELIELRMPNPDNSVVKKVELNL